MKPHDNRHGAHDRADRHYDYDFKLQHLKPGAFTVLPSDDELPPDPPRAPSPYRLTPTTKRHRNQAFSIIAEPNASRQGSRSPSPSGRVSPFRGRGFNPAGSRFATPNASPPPEDARLSPTGVQSPRQSKIPQLTRRGSAVAFGEKVTPNNPSNTKRKFNTQLSQSLSNISTTKKVTLKPPPSPTKKTGYSNKPQAFQRLSPIVGSSPEPSQSQSSPSRIPKTRSTPHSRVTSPINPIPSALVTKPSHQKGLAKPVSRTPSRKASREASPSKIPTSPTRIPTKTFKNVQAKVNSFSSKPKPKVPQKPAVVSEQSDSDVPKVVNRPRPIRKDSINKRDSKLNLVIKTEGKTNTNSTNINSNKISNSSNINNETDNKNSSASNKNINKTNISGGYKKQPVPDTRKNNNTNKSSNNSNTKVSETNLETTSATETSNYNDTPTSASEDDLNKSESVIKLTDILHPSTTAVVSSTTTTVTQPLKIDAKIEPRVQYDKPKPVSPMVDGRVLSATSVSNAINKMNDTVLDTQTLKDGGYSKLSPAASAIISVAKESKSSPQQTNQVQNNPALDTKNATTALPTVEPITTKPSTVANNNNHVITHAGVVNSRALEEEVQKNMSKLISPEHAMGNSVQKSINDRIIEARTLVAADVKPIRITVKEKPGVEVQSGNVRMIPVSATNGLDRPGIPPAQQSPPNEAAQPQTEEKKNGCTRFISTCKSKLSCKRKNKEVVSEKKEVEENKEVKPGCFNCLKKKQQEPEEVRITIEEEDNEPPKKKLYERIICCGKDKVRDKGFFSFGKKKENWAERRESILSTPPTQLKRSKCSKECCRNFFRKVFCVNLCCKKTNQDPISRKASLVSSKKKSLTPTSVIPEEPKAKLDISLVEHTSHMKAAIPVLPICLAWFCCIMNCLGPGTGTILSGLFCLCIGKPRFSQKDAPKQRIGAFVIDVIIGAGQFFTVLFCLVGWGWSIWWGVIMVKVARKYQKIQQLEAAAEPSDQETFNTQNRSRHPGRGF